MNNSKIKMLCLHGFGQNATIFNNRLSSFRSKIKNKYDFIIPQAPHRLEETGDEEVYGWYYYNEKNPAEVNWDQLVNRIVDMDQLLGLRQSIQLIEDILSQNPEIEFIMGFSQGAAFLSLLCQLGIVPDDKKLIFVGGFYPLKYDTLYQKFNHQSTHVYGEADMIILPQYSQDLAQFFNHATIITHKGKHTIPRFKFE